MRSSSLWHFFCVHTKLTYMPESFINSWMLTYLCCTLWEHYHVNKPYRSVIWQTRTVSIITHQWYSHLCSFQHRCVHVHRHTRSLTVHPQHIHTIQHSSPVLASLYLMILTLHAQQRGTPFCTESLRGYNKRQKRRLCCALSFFPWQKKKKKGREGRKKKSGQQQLNSYISGFVEAEEVCSWGGSGGRGGRPLFFSQTTKTPHPLKHFEFFFFFFFASLQPEDADQD